MSHQDMFFHCHFSVKAKQVRPLHFQCHRQWRAWLPSDETQIVNSKRVFLPTLDCLITNIYIRNWFDFFNIVIFYLNRLCTLFLFILIRYLSPFFYVVLFVTDLKVVPATHKEKDTIAMIDDISTDITANILEDRKLIMLQHADCETFLGSAPSTVALLGHLTIFALKKDFEIGGKEQGRHAEKIQWSNSFRASMLQVRICSYTNTLSMWRRSSPSVD